MNFRKIINGQESIDRHNEFFTFSPERQRVEYYTNRNSRNSMYSYLYEDDAKICLASDSRLVRYANGKAWSQENTKDRRGFTYDKLTKKIKLWYNTKLHSFTPYEMNELLVHTGTEWFKPLYGGVYNILTPTLFGKVLSKKITNPIDFCKAFIKSKPWLKNSDMSPAQLHKLLVSMDKHNGTLSTYIQYFCVAKSATVLSEQIINRNLATYYSLHDCITQCLALDKKLDFSWSEKRVNEYHNELTREIMDFKIANIKDTRINYTELPPIPNCLVLLSSERELFEEGALMRHCVYTNYWSAVETKTYFVFSYTNDDIRATIGVTTDWDNKEFRIQQMYQKFNQSVPDVDRDYVADIIRSKEMQDWFRLNSKRQKLPEMEDVVENLMW